MFHTDYGIQTCSGALPFLAVKVITDTDDINSVFCISCNMHFTRVTTRDVLICYCLQYISSKTFPTVRVRHPMIKAINSHS